MKNEAMRATLGVEKLLGLFSVHLHVHGCFNGIQKVDGLVIKSLLC